jgi:hypothetical protein
MRTLILRGTFVRGEREGAKRAAWSAPGACHHVKNKITMGSFAAAA